MRPRMYGSRESQCTRKRTWPSATLGTSVSTMRKSDSATWPCGRRARRIWRFFMAPSASRVAPRDRLGDAGGLLAPLRLDRHLPGELDAAGDVLEGERREARPDLLPGAHGGGKAHLVEPVVHGQLAGRQRQRVR